jgi:tetratricopeptide (TPR) repeat protein
VQIDKAIQSIAARNPNGDEGMQLFVMKGRYLRQAKQYTEAEAALKQAIQRLSTYYTDGNLYKWAVDEYAKTLEETGRRAEAGKVRAAGKLGRVDRLLQYATIPGI